MILAQHPTISGGWLIVTPAVETLLAADWLVVNPTDGSTMHPLAVHEPDFTDADVEPARVWALAQVQAAAEAARGLVITLQPGKIGAYSQKRDEVTLWQANGSPTLPLLFNQNDYPIAKAEAPVWGYTTLQMLQVWEVKIAEWATASAVIEATERAALMAVAAAEDVAGIAAVLAGLAFGV